MTKEHPYAELLRAIADGHSVEMSCNNSGRWFTPDLVEIFELFNEHDCHYSWRIKPQPKPDIVTRMFAEAYPKLENAWNRPNLELTFDGETQKLKSVRILDAT